MQRLSNIFVLFILTFIYVSTFATQRQDSLLNLLPNTTDNKKKAEIYLQLGESYLFSKPDSSNFYAQKGIYLLDTNIANTILIDLLGLEATSCFYTRNYTGAQKSNVKMYRLAKEINDKRGLLRSSKGAGISFLYIGEFQKSLKYFLINDSLIDSDNYKAKAKINMNLASVYTQLNDYSKALEYITNTTNFYEKLNDSSNLIYAYNISGITYYNLDEDLLAIKYYKKALKLNETLNIQNFTSEILSNLALVYMNMDDKLDSALLLFHKALETSTLEPGSGDRMIILTNLGTTYYKNNEIDKSISLFQQVLNSPYVNERYHILEATYVNLAQSFIAKQFYDSAYAYAKKGIETSSITGDLEFKIYGLEHLIFIDSLRSDYKSLSIHQKEFYEDKLKLNDKESKEKIAEILGNIELEKRNKENSLLIEQAKHQKDSINRKTLINIIISIGFVIVIIFASFLFFLRRKTQKLNFQLKNKNKTIEEQTLLLKTAIKSKDVFFNIIGHDLKNPFNGLIGLLKELDNNNELSKEEQKHLISILHTTSVNTHKFLINLLEWATSQSGQLKANIESVELDKLVAVCLSAHHSQIQQKQIELNIIACSNIRVKADQEMLKTILRNYLNNAIKFSPIKGVIEISSEQSDNYIRLKIKDQGIGIPNDKLENIFSIDSTYRNIGTMQEKGNGLGLKIVSEFARNMKAKVGVESIENQGSTFWIDLELDSRN